MLQSVRKYGAKQMRVFQYSDDREVLFSYSTVVAVRLKGDVFVTQDKYSSTTTKHINIYLREVRGNGTVRNTGYTPQRFIDMMYQDILTK